MYESKSTWLSLATFALYQTINKSFVNAGISKTTVGSTLVGSQILKKGKCICKTIEMCFKGLISFPIYVRSIEKHVRHLV